MAELTPLERLQPCLLDRLTDDDPKNTEESRTQRVISLGRYKKGVLRDIEWLLNCSAIVPRPNDPDLDDFPEVKKSVLNFGTRQLCGLVGPDMDEFERELAEALHLFEPRILQNSVTIKTSKERNIVGLEINGDLWANPVPERLYIRTKIDLETGQTSIGESSNG
jgi:type VI secretion system protein ImpF